MGSPVHVGHVCRVAGSAARQSCMEPRPRDIGKATHWIPPSPQGSRPSLMCMPSRCAAPPARDDERGQSIVPSKVFGGSIPKGRPAAGRTGASRRTRCLSEPIPNGCCVEIVDGHARPEYPPQGERLRGDVAGPRIRTSVCNWCSTEALRLSLSLDVSSTTSMSCRAMSALEPWPSGLM